MDERRRKFAQTNSRRPSTHLPQWKPRCLHSQIAAIHPNSKKKDDTWYIHSGRCVRQQAQVQSQVLSQEKPVKTLERSKKKRTRTRKPFICVSPSPSFFLTSSTSLPSLRLTECQVLEPRETDHERSAGTDGEEIVVVRIGSRKRRGGR